MKLSVASLLFAVVPAVALQVGVLRSPVSVASRSLGPRMELEAASTSEVAQAAPLSEQQLWKPDGLLSRDVVVLPHVANLLSANPALGDILRRAEFWSNETATLLEVLNVLGRWQTADQIKERSLFTPEDMNPREENIFQSATKRRYEMAQRLGSCERMGLIQNAKGLPFTDEKLAASVRARHTPLPSRPTALTAIPSHGVPCLAVPSCPTPIQSYPTPPRRHPIQSHPNQPQPAISAHSHSEAPPIPLQVPPIPLRVPPVSS